MVYCTTAGQPCARAGFLLTPTELAAMRIPRPHALLRKAAEVPQTVGNPSTLNTYIAMRWRAYRRHIKAGSAEHREWMA